jgi:predicted PurR-regulated permease PerM
MIALSWRTWLALAALGPAIYLGIQMLPLLCNLGLLLLIILLLTLLIMPLADRLERRGIPRSVTAFTTLGGAVTLLTALVVMLLPILFESLSLLAGALVALTNRIAVDLDTSALNDLGDLGNLGDLNELLIGQAASALQWAISQLGGAAGQVGVALGQVGAFSFAAMVALVVIFTLVAQKAAVVHLMHVFVPAAYHQRAIQLTHAVSHGLSRWFVAQLAICGYYALAYSVTNLLLGVPYGVQIGIVSGLLEFIPYLGGIVGMILGALAAATVSPTLALITLVVNVIIGAICVYVVAPYAFAKAVEVPAALILLGLFIGAQIGGFFAALLTVPLVTTGIVILRELRPDLRPQQTEETPAVADQNALEQA